MSHDRAKGRATPTGRDEREAETLTPERWSRIQDLLLAALDLSEGERAAFLARSCAGDDALLREVQSLLVAHDSAGPADRLANTLGARVLTELIEGEGLDGETVGRYELRERFGRGGMGVVYRAWDPRLERDVALKCLPRLLSADEARRGRLLAEAQTAASLEHPNICTIHEIVDAPDGRLFITMPLYDGETLMARLREGPLSVKEALGLALQTARGLGQAHERGVIHRDIKPGNLMITRDGTLKILDFGIAQAEGAIDRRSRTPGTAHYMSPEQFAGGPIDGRSDLWSLGVVLYEMLTGHRPFEGRTYEEVLHAVVHDDVVPLSTLLPDVPPTLDELIRRLLQKDPSRRPRSAAEVVEALRRADQPAPKGRVLRAAAAILVCVVLGIAAFAVGRPGSRSAVEVPRIAILPLATLTDDPEQDYFAAAMTDQLISQLARLSDLQVIAHSAVVPYENHMRPVRAIARELGVDAVIEGSVTRYGDRVRIVARLIDGETETQLWSRDFTRDFRDLLSLEREVATEIAREVEINLSPEEESRLGRARSVSPEAQAAFLRGVYLQRRYQVDQSSDTVIAQSIEYLTRATDLEPEWPEAHAELARAYHWRASGPVEPGRDEDYRRAKAAAERALRLDETVAGGHAALAFVLHTYEWDWVAAEREYRRALELAPNDNYYRWGWAIFETHAARYDEAVTDFQWALEQAPLSHQLIAQLANALACAGRDDEVLAIADQYDDDDPSVLQMRGRLLLRRGLGARALEHFERSVAVQDSGTAELASLAHAHASLGHEKEARALLITLEAQEDLEGWGIWLPAIYAELGEPQRALDHLELLFDQRHPALLALQCSSGAAFADLTQLDALAEEPRMRALLRRIDFPAWGRDG